MAAHTDLSEADGEEEEWTQVQRNKKAAAPEPETIEEEDEEDDKDDDAAAGPSGPYLPWGKAPESVASFFSYQRPVPLGMITSSVSAWKRYHAWQASSDSKLIGEGGSFVKLLKKQEKIKFSDEHKKRIENSVGVYIKHLFSEPDAGLEYDDWRQKLAGSVGGFSFEDSKTPDQKETVFEFLKRTGSTNPREDIAAKVSIPEEYRKEQTEQRGKDTLKLKIEMFLADMYTAWLNGSTK